MEDEPHPLRGDWVHPPAGFHSYPPPRPRFPGPRQTCTHCGLTSETSARECPVCGERYRARLARRLVEAIRSR
jgi:hypothetical protein